jgi:hypothetical protein
MYLTDINRLRPLLFACCLLAALPLLSLGQKTTPKIKFESYTAIGTLFGNQTVHGQLQTVNGLSSGPWFLGLGVGLDEYRLRTVPVFADLRYRYGKRRNQWFAYADLGYSIATNTVTGLDGDYYFERDIQGGLYYDAGVGYQIPITKKGWGLFVSAGFSQKYASETAKAYVWQPGILPLPDDAQVEALDYRLSRISIKVGWKF